MLGFTNFTKRTPRGGSGGAHQKLKYEVSNKKKCIFWLKMAVSVVPAPPGAPPDVVKKKLSTFSKKYPNIDRGALRGASRLEKPIFREKKVL